MLVKAATALGISPKALLPDETGTDDAAPRMTTALIGVRGAEPLVEASAVMPGRFRRVLLQLARVLAEPAPTTGP